MAVVALLAALSVAADEPGATRCAEVLERELAVRRAPSLSAPPHHELLPTLRVAEPANASDVRVVWYVHVSAADAMPVVQLALEHLYVPSDAFLVHAHPRVRALVAEQLAPTMSARANVALLGDVSERDEDDGSASLARVSAARMLHAIRAVLRSRLAFDFFVPLHEAELPLSLIHI